MTDDKLLSDEEFADLMEAEYQAAGSPVDEISKAKTWNRIRRRLRQNNNRKQTYLWGQVAALAAVLVMGVSFYVMQQGSDVTRPKGDAAPVPAQLRAFVLEDDGNLRLLAGEEVQLGETVVFKVSLNSDAAGSLFLVPDATDESPEPVDPAPSHANATAEVVVPSQMFEGGQEHLLGTGEETYGYRFATPQSLRVCFLGAEDAADLKLWLNELTAEIIQSATCLTIAVAGP